jgi:hypothetical protein
MKMIEHVSALIHSTSLLARGEVCPLEKRATPVPVADALAVGYRVVGDSRSGKEDARECGISPTIKPPGRVRCRARSQSHHISREAE